jgi:hypothetical protein
LEVILGILRQVRLSSPREPLQIRIPPNFTGEKSSEGSDGEIYISNQPTFLTPDEITLVEEYLAKLPYRQTLAYTGCVLIDKEDPLLSYTLAQLDDLERKHGLPSTRNVPKKGERSLYERVHMIRENGFVQNN